MNLNHRVRVSVIFKVNPKAGFKFYADADFAGTFQHEFSQQDPACAKSRSGWYIMYPGCPIVWAFKWQILVALSTTKSKYFASSFALCDIILIMQLINKMKGKGFQLLCTLPHIHCKAFEDNSGTLELAQLPKMRQQTKHIAVCYHHFCEQICQGRIKTFPNSTDLQPIDMATKALPDE